MALRMKNSLSARLGSITAASKFRVGGGFCPQLGRDGRPRIHKSGSRAPAQQQRASWSTCAPAAVAHIRGETPSTRSHQAPVRMISSYTGNIARSSFTISRPSGLWLRTVPPGSLAVRKSSRTACPAHRPSPTGSRGRGSDDASHLGYPHPQLRHVRLHVVLRTGGADSVRCGGESGPDRLQAGQAVPWTNHSHTSPRGPGAPGPRVEGRTAGARRTTNSPEGRASIPEDL